MELCFTHNLVKFLQNKKRVFKFYGEYYNIQHRIWKYNPNPQKKRGVKQIMPNQLKYMLQANFTQVKRFNTLEKNKKRKEEKENAR